MQTAVTFSGVVDFESVRLGDGMWDVAIMAMRLLQQRQVHEAAAWREVACRMWGVSRLREQVPGMLVWIHVNRVLAAKRDPLVDVAPPRAVLAEVHAYLASS